MSANAFADLFRNATRDDVATPAAFRSGLAELGFSDFDPCPLFGAATLEQFNGLTATWPTDAPIYVNPPFSDVRPWLEKVNESVTEGARVAVMMPVRSNTRYWQTHVKDKAIGFMLINSRIMFDGYARGAPMPMILVFFGFSVDEMKVMAEKKTIGDEPVQMCLFI